MDSENTWHEKEENEDDEVNEEKDKKKEDWENEENEDDWENEDNDNNNLEDFAQLLQQSEMTLNIIQVGKKVQGSVCAIPENSTHVLIDLGAKSAGIIPKNELFDDEGKLSVKIGDKVEASVISNKHGEILLSKTMARRASSPDEIISAYKNKIPVKGKVIKENKGGFEISVLGKKAFCPISQIDLTFVEDKAPYIGKEYDFLIEKLDLSSNNIVVSRSVLLKKDEEKRINKLMESVKLGSILTGKVSEIRDYGAFVDLGGITGMVHISEISFGHIENIKEALNIGDEVQVKVLYVEKEREKDRYKISLSIKEATENPWDSVLQNYKISNSYQGKVVRLMNFGAFVELKSGLEGLVHISEMSWAKRINHPSEIVQVGDIVSTTILSIDETNQKMSLSMKDISEDPWNNIRSKYPVGQTIKGTVEQLRNFGAIVTIAPGLSGLVPISSLKRVLGDAYRKKSCPQNELFVTIQEINEEEKKILLDLQDTEDKSGEQKDYNEYIKKTAQGQSNSDKKPTQMGSLGQLLAEKLKEEDK